MGDGTVGDDQQASNASNQTPQRVRRRSDRRVVGRVSRQVGRVWRGLGRARFNAIALVGAFLALAALGGALAMVTHPSAPGPLVIDAPTATPASLFPLTPTLGAYPTSQATPSPGAGLGVIAPNAPAISTPAANIAVPTICPPAAAAPTTPAETPTAGQAEAGGCTPCGVDLGGAPTQGQVRSALATAANVYRLPHNLLFAVAWEESSWREDIISCDGGIGLMQIQTTTYAWLNQQRVPACQLGVTDYDPFTLEGNADLGAKYLKYLSCFYSYWGADANATPSSPGAYTAAWYYQQARRPYPDATTAQSLCASVFHTSVVPQYAALPATVADPWSCPFSAQVGDYTLLDLTLSAYNQGAAYTNQYGVQNLGYVRAVEAQVAPFADGTLPH